MTDTDPALTSSEQETIDTRLLMRQREALFHAERKTFLLLNGAWNLRVGLCVVAAVNIAMGDAPIALFTASSIIFAGYADSSENPGSAEFLGWGAKLLGSAGLILTAFAVLL